MDRHAKTHLRETARASAVDMESHLAVDFARERAIPFAVLRAISDPAARALPPLAAKALTPLLKTYEGIAGKGAKAAKADAEVKLKTRKAINEAACLGFCPPAGVIVPRVMDFALQVESPPYDPAKAKQLLAEAGYPKGFDAGDLWCDAATGTMSEALAGFDGTVSSPSRRKARGRARRSVFVVGELDMFETVFASDSLCQKNPARAPSLWTFPV